VLATRALAGRDDVLLCIKCWNGSFGVATLCVWTKLGTAGPNGVDSTGHADADGEGDSDDNAKGSLPLDEKSLLVVEEVAVTVECLLCELEVAAPELEVADLGWFELLYNDMVSVDGRFLAEEGRAVGEEKELKRLGRKKKCFPLRLLLL
jgi:hypothetical protein